MDSSIRGTPIFWGLTEVVTLLEDETTRNEENRNAALQLVKENGLKLEELIEKDKNDREIVAEAVKQNPRAIWFTGEVLRKDLEFMVSLAHKLSVFKLSLDESLNVMIMYENEILVLETSAEAKKRLSSCPNPLIFVPFIPTGLATNRDFVLERIKKNGLELKDVAEHFKSDPEIVNAAIKQNPHAREFATIDLPDNGENGEKISVAATFLREADGVYQITVSERLKALMRVQANGLSLQDFKGKYDEDEQIVTEGIRQNPRAIIFVSQKLLLNEEFLQRLKKQKLIESIKKEGDTIIISIDSNKFKADYVVKPGEEIKENIEEMELEFYRYDAETKEYVKTKFPEKK